jgi:hypothetical protein
MNEKMRKYFLAFPLIFLAFLESCGPSISQEEFVKQFHELSQNRNNFKKSMKALGDSSFAHQEFSAFVWQEVNLDTAFERKIEPNYKAYNDSLRKKILEGQAYFATQWTNNKPFIQKWESLDMRFDRMVETMKKGDLGEKEGLDSLRFLDKEMKSYVKTSDSLERAATNRYWEFRKTFEEFKYNMLNLKVLYAGKLSDKK